MLNVLSYIIPNVIIALVLICGVINGQKLGWKKSLIKLSYTLVLAVGLFFLNAYVIVPAFAKIGSDITLLIALLPSVLWTVEFAICMGLAQLIFTLVCHSMDKERKMHILEMRAVREADVTRKTKEARREERHQERVRKHEMRMHRKEEMKAWRKAHKVSRTFGAIFSFIGSAVICFIMMMCVSNIGIMFSGNEAVGDKISNFYDHSVIGLVDNAANKDSETLAEKVLTFELSNIDIGE